MKKRILVLSVFILTAVFSVKAQNSWGAKGSLVFNSNGELISEVSGIVDTKGSTKAGFNVGLYGVLNLGPIFLRPELVYTSASSEYTNKLGVTESLKTSSIDLPVLVGIRLIGPLKLVAGPAFKFILNNKYGDLESESLKSNVTLGFNIGASVEFGRFGVDVIYDRGFSNNEASFISDNITEHDFTIDTRPQQIKVGLSYRLSADK